jgi:high-affinity Fe2+/Pb2+ permease
VLGAVLGGALVALRLAADLQALPVVLGIAVAGVLAYWLAFYVWVLDAGERALVTGVLRRSR